MRNGTLVYVHGEESLGVVLSVDDFCNSAEVRVQSDGQTVSASLLQLEPMEHGPLTEEEAAHERYYEEMEQEEQAARAAGGLRICPDCGERSVRVHTRATRQYGGGTDTFYDCERCEYAEVCV